MTSRDGAIRILEDGHRRLAALLAGLEPRELVRTGIGSGDWSPTDLAAHVAFWERSALDALEAWERGEGAPIDRALRERGLNRVNAEAVLAARELEPADVLRRAERTHEDIVRAIRALPDDRWVRPPTRRIRRPLGEKVGGILGGPGGRFRHAEAHIPELEAFVAGER